MSGIRIPQIQSIDDALILYYSKPELENKDIRFLYGRIGSAKIAQLKELARAVMSEKGIEVLNNSRVNTKAAYVAWGIDIEDVEARQRKLIQIKNRMEGKKNGSNQKQ